jgi:hypothetical protein
MEPTYYAQFVRTLATVTKREDRAIAEAQSKGPQTRDAIRAVCVQYQVAAKLYNEGSELVGKIDRHGRAVIG